jgi:hypothetical protein
MMECDGFSSNQIELVSRYLQHVLCFDPTAKLDDSLKEKKVEYTRNRRNQLKDQRGWRPPTALKPSLQLRLS